MPDTHPIKLIKVGRQKVQINSTKTELGHINQIEQINKDTQSLKWSENIKNIFRITN